jgi:PAS domain S-box-containing protein
LDRKLAMTSSLSASVSDLVQQTLLSEAADALGVGVIVYNEDGAYLAANHEACRLTGYPRQALLELEFGTLSGENARELAQQTASAGRSRGRGALRRADGSSVEVEWVAVPTRVANLPAMASLFWAAGSLD